MVDQNQQSKITGRHAKTQKTAAVDEIIQENASRSVGELDVEVGIGRESIGSSGPL